MSSAVHLPQSGLPQCGVCRRAYPSELGGLDFKALRDGRMRVTHHGSVFHECPEEFARSSADRRESSRA